MADATLRERLRDIPPQDFAVRPAWIRLIQALRASKRATGRRAFLSSRAAVERALDTPLSYSGDDLSRLKEQLRSLSRELSERDSSDAEVRAVAESIDVLVQRLLPRVVSGPVSLQVTGWPDGLPVAHRERMLRRSLESLSAMPAAEAAAWVREFDGMVLGGQRLAVSARLSDGEQLPAVPRELRARPMLRGRKGAWLPHLDEEGRRSLTDRPRAEAHAQLVDAPVVIDACCGCGGNAIAFALAGKTVVGIEPDLGRLELARRNAAHFGVSERIRFVHGELQEHLAALVDENPDTAVFVDPPWRVGEVIDEAPRWPELLPGGQETADALSEASSLLLKLPRSFDLASLPPRPWQVEWGFGDGSQRSVILMITCWSPNPSLHR